jgi:hypothetical protein
VNFIDYRDEGIWGSSQVLPLEHDLGQISQLHELKLLL